LTQLDDEAIEAVEHYILELQERLIPYGFHTYGVSPQGAPLHDLAEAICVASPEIKTEEMTARLQECGPREMASLFRALQGKYIPPGEGNDPVRNPAAVPTGRNFHGLDLNKVPSKEAFALGRKLADDMIKGYREKHGAYPDKLGIVLWSYETQINEGVNESAALHLLGITPVWDKKDRVVDLKPIPGRILKRPRIDVLLQASGLYRDTFSQVIKWLDRAVRLAGSLRDVENFVALHSARIAHALQKKGYGPAEARELSQVRVFAPKPGAYGNGVQDLIPDSGTWEDDREIADVWIQQAAFAYGDKFWGKPLKSAYKYNLKDIKITMHSRSSNLVYMLDNDDMFGFLGGLSLAVKSQAGKFPEVQIANNQKAREVTQDDLNKSIGKALRTRYLNPKWIEGMKKEGYGGARLMDKFVEHLWGFQVTTPFAVDKTYWEQIHEVYLTDKYHQGLKDFFDRHNPWALQSISARMLEADRKGYWQAPLEMKKNLARTYALSVIEKGVACSEHICNNPKLQRVVTEIIARHGLLTPPQLDRFKRVMAKATGQTQKEQEAEHQKTREGLTRTLQEIQKDEDILAQGERKKIEGFEMVEQKPQETNRTASGSPWAVMAIVLALLALFYTGWQWKRLKI
jgi:cobaltochelatase CobN